MAEMIIMGSEFAIVEQNDDERIIMYYYEMF